MKAWLHAAHTLAQRGDPAATEALIAVYRTRPELLDRLAALAGASEVAWLEVLTPQGAGMATLTRHVADREIDRLKADLAGGVADPLEHLLIARIAVAWLAVQYADRHLAQGLDGGKTWAQIEYRARHAERMNRVFLRAIESLARVRRLRFGAVQVNIADQQINLA